MPIEKTNNARDKMKQKSHIRNLLGIAITDGSFDSKEKELIMEIGKRSGISQDELKEIDLHPASVSFIKPESNRERIEQLYDLVLLILINDEIAKNETSLCKSFAVKLGLEMKTINTVLPHLIKSISAGEETQKTINELLSMIEE
jgi:uncharacterized membrane protein YebE (DUF533 family)